ncbi:TPA: EndoU domain-containing protein [Clostridioides difficile]|nr:phage minor capsid protein [Clostridioides difficile]HBF5147635.1 EndoU domain-containing protein [Clostridioides difficile]HBF6468898.1 EndoU domain-containing protein [Clostridioides difficile]HBH3651446.1 EndoU domain-containing protein [Clostridioides difficile]HDO9657098.1 EndoU domain-containing protein [Clostridioides difficile]
MTLNPYDIASIYNDMELDLVKSMKQNMKLHESEELKEGFKWEQWQKTKLREIKKFQKRNKGIIKDYQKIVDGETDKLLKSSFKNGSKRSENFISKTLNKVSSKFKNMFEPKEKSFFKINENKVFSLIKSVKGDLHNANHAALRKMDDVYRQTIFKSQMYVVNGAMTVNQAVDMATKDFLDKGINCITYKNGRKVNISSYAEMSIRTANQRVTLMGEGIKRDEYGVHTVITSNHTNTCPLCLPWQGRVLIDDVYSKGSSKEGRYPLLSEAMSLGFLHPNCRHHLTTFFPDINKIPKPLTEEEKQDALERYNAEQKQREIERNIRKWKRIEAGSTDLTNIAKASNNLHKYELEMSNHLNEYSYLRRDNWREKIRKDEVERFKNELKNGEYLKIPEFTLNHAIVGEFTNPKNPKKIKPGDIRLKSGGHSEENIQLLKEKGIEYNIVKEYENGVRVGNVPTHKLAAKKSGTGQAWFPKNWGKEDIENAGNYVSNIGDKSKYILEKKYNTEGKITAIFKFSNYKNVTVCVCYDVNREKITTIFPDENQRMLGGD